MTRTSAKGNFKPKRVQLTCPVCGRRFSLMPSEHRKIVARGVTPSCSKVCSQEWRRVCRAEVPEVPA